MSIEWLAVPPLNRARRRRFYRTGRPGAGYDAPWRAGPKGTYKHPTAGQVGKTFPFSSAEPSFGSSHWWWKQTCLCRSWNPQDVLLSDMCEVLSNLSCAILLICDLQYVCDLVCSVVCGVVCNVVRPEPPPWRGWRANPPQISRCKSRPAFCAAGMAAIEPPSRQWLVRALSDSSGSAEPARSRRGEDAR